MSARPTPANWEYDGLWQKAKIYTQRGLECPREDVLFPFWMSLALEFLARASVAYVHPVLLADPRDGQNLLQAFGYSSAKATKSITMKTVLERCVVIVPEFTSKHMDTALTITERRNAEFHTGSPAFEGVDTSQWLASWYELADLLLKQQDRTLADLLGQNEADAAMTMIESAAQDLRTKVAEEIAAAEKRFAALEPGVRESRLAVGKGSSLQIETRGRDLEKSAECPSCGSPAVMDGEQVSVSDDRIEDGMIVDHVVVLPTTLQCNVCGLALGSHAELHAAGLGGQYSVERAVDASYYYGREFSEPDFDYGND